MVGKTSGNSVWIEAVSPNFPVAFEFAAMHSQQQQEQKIHNGMSLCTRRMAKTKKSDTTQVWRRCGEIGSIKGGKTREFSEQIFGNSPVSEEKKNWEQLCLNLRACKIVPCTWNSGSVWKGAGSRTRFWRPCELTAN